MTSAPKAGEPAIRARINAAPTAERSKTLDNFIRPLLSPDGRRAPRAGGVLASHLCSRRCPKRRRGRRSGGGPGGTAAGNRSKLLLRAHGLGDLQARGAGLRRDADVDAMQMGGVATAVRLVGIRGGRIAVAGLVEALYRGAGWGR